ncbi:MAG: hypothetical protein HZA54_08835 [Planctomycetes bacterium]|nr:hypothetical protein [Planctomycetota bacterium]
MTGNLLAPAPAVEAGGRTGARDLVVSALILLIGLHSCLLGLAMLLLPARMLALLGFPGSVPVFFPSQSGIFLLALGICYLLALARRPLVIVILVSKALAVPFLTIHAAFLAAPPLIWAADAVDALMLAALAIALRRQGNHRTVTPDELPEES